MAAGDQVVRVGETLTDHFLCTNSSGVPQTGLTMTLLFARYGAGDTNFASAVTFSERGNGEYRLQFPVTAPGPWRLGWQTAYQDFYGLYEVAPSSAHADEPFAYRVGETVYAYDYQPGAAVSAGSWTLLYARDPNDAAFTPNLTHLGGGEYRMTFAAARPGAHRAEWAYQGWRLELNVVVLDAYATRTSGNTRAEIRDEIARRLNDLTTGSLTTGSATVPADSVRWEEANHFQGGTLLLKGGNAAGQYRTITAFSAGVYTVAPAFSTTPNVGDAYAVYRRYNLDDYNNAIAAAVRVLRQFVLVDVVDSTLTIVQNQYDYALPAGFNLLTRVELQDPSRDELFKTLGRRGWELKLNGENPTFRLHPNDVALYTAPGRTIRLYGKQYADSLASDGDKTQVSTGVLVPWAAAWLLETKSLGKGDPGDVLTRINLLMVEVQDLLPKAHPRPLWAGSRRARP